MAIESIYLLDTNVIVELLRGNPIIREKIQSIGLSRCFISEITIAELTYGAINSGITEELNDVDTITKLFQIIPIAQTFTEYGHIRTSLRKEGLLVDQFDMLIAATALHYSLVVVTHNRKHFQRIPSLSIEDWQ